MKQEKSIFARGNDMNQLAVFQLSWEKGMWNESASTEQKHIRIALRRVRDGPVACTSGAYNMRDGTIAQVIDASVHA